MGQSEAVPDESPTDYFEAHGFEVTIEERDLYGDHMARGDPGRATFYVEGQRYFCVDLCRDGATIARHYGIGETPDAALENAKRRFGSEQH
jgi:hypothetical protein